MNRDETRRKKTRTRTRTEQKEEAKEAPAQPRAPTGMAAWRASSKMSMIFLGDRKRAMLMAMIISTDPQRFEPDALHENVRSAKEATSSRRLFMFRMLEKLGVTRSIKAVIDATDAPQHSRCGTATACELVSSLLSRLEAAARSAFRIRQNESRVYGAITLCRREPQPRW